MCDRYLAASAAFSRSNPTIELTWGETAAKPAKV
jgi:hypothetical protein